MVELPYIYSLNFAENFHFEKCGMSPILAHAKAVAGTRWQERLLPHHTYKKMEI